MAAYVTVRESLTLFLYYRGLSLAQTYAVATSAVSLFAVCSILWGVFYQYLPNHKTLLKFSLCLAIIAYFLLVHPIPHFKILGISLYVVAGSLYLLTINLFVNAHFKENQTRCLGNQAYQVAINIGGFFGVLGIAILPIGMYKPLYLASAIILIGSLVLFIFTSDKLLDSDKPDQNNWIFAAITIVMIMLTFVLMMHGAITRDIMIGAFIISLIYIITLTWREKNKKYVLFLMLLIFSNTLFWLTSAVLNIQFPIFLAQDVHSNFFGIAITPLSVLAMDPFSNILFGLIIYMCFDRYNFNEYGMLAFAQCMLFISVVILTFALWESQGQVALFWPLLTRVFFAIAEFIIATTLRAQVAELIGELNRQGFFMGMLKLSQAFAASMAFFITTSFITNSSKQISIRLTQDFNLYLFLSVIIGVSMIVMLIIWRQNRSQPN